MDSTPALILASSSPRRRALLTELGLDFTVAAADVDERACPGESPADLVVRLSQSKGRAIAEKHLGALILAADTVVVLDNEVLGKPAGPAQAAEMLSALRGRMHHVLTAVSLVKAVGPSRDPDLTTRLSCSKVWIRNFTDDEIRDYVATGDPLDKAGAYAIQHPRLSPVERWDGCYTAIMGLPLGAVAELLSQAGVSPAAGLPPPDNVIAVCERQSGRCCLRSGQIGCGHQVGC
jgi:MAF protein